MVWAQNIKVNSLNAGEKHSFHLKKSSALKKTTTKNISVMENKAKWCLLRVTIVWLMLFAWSIFLFPALLNLKQMTAYYNGLLSLLVVISRRSLVIAAEHFQGNSSSRKNMAEEYSFCVSSRVLLLLSKPE